MKDALKVYGPLAAAIVLAVSAALQLVLMTALWRHYRRQWQAEPEASS